MQPWFGGALLVFGVRPAQCLISIVGAAVRESALPPGDQPRKKWRPRIAMACATVALAAFAVGGRSWWNEVDTDYRSNRLYKPESIGAHIIEQDAHPVCRWSDWKTGADGPA
jgi:hypothetical protein